ncbi:MAG: MarR family winged helix-turn-helix transcriptional regulator [Desulfurococcaceae archaeon]
MTPTLNKHDITLLKWLGRLNKPVYQSDIPRITGLDMKIVTKSIYKLEKINLVKRRPAVHNKRRTYIVTVDTNKVVKTLEEHGETLLTLSEVFKEISDVPCITCPYIFKCYEGGFYDPLYCQMLSNFIFKGNSRRTK